MGRGFCFALASALAVVFGCDGGAGAEASDAGENQEGGGSGSDAPAEAPLRDSFPPDAFGPEMPCNWSPEFCELRYDQLTFVGTHESAAYVTPPWKHPAQRRRVRAQLDDGVRAIFLEAHRGAMLVACYGDCSAGSVPLSGPLTEVREFLEANPREVVTIVIDNRAGGELRGTFEAAGLTDFVLAHDPGAPWPTLGEIVLGGRRLVVLENQDAESDAGVAGFIPLSRVAFATADGAPTSADLSCAVTRGERQEGSMFVVHHYVRAASESGGGDAAARLPSEELAASANADPFLTRRLEACEVEQAHVANVVDVDFYDIGDVLNAVTLLNRKRKRQP
jgi:hypothetical protein